MSFRVRNQLSIKSDLEIEKIHDVALREAGEESFLPVGWQDESLQDPVSEIPQDSCGQQSCRQSQKKGVEGPPLPEVVKGSQRNEGNHEKHNRRPGGSIAQPESRSLVVHAHDGEEVLHHHVGLLRKVGPWRGRRKVQDYQPLGNLVEQVKRQDEDEEQAREGIHDAAPDNTSSQRPHNPVPSPSTDCSVAGGS